ncbi:NUDIX hydrolase [Cycloclasticus pugetii]|jgi:8-oxo-dGTP pyrophosphatase MutT (NUDIX family)|uniref:NUDIX hydrolase n=1 Tax=Cycloclasticus pugetii TaxID=34068 RepID=UPI00091252F9|nr:NUDIX hydrolase [Cycloclasticus pugetii]SHJ43843.1 NUDIX domain-containing protein [Cycloclasticus pugetii]|tara:strand:- start:2098 stop:2547 length:450 start_codon:yes stop_codon:yes gene_type:complete
MIWKPNVTVASIVELDGKFLMVEEESPVGPVLNQPAGHLDPNESMENAVIRETLEETGYHFTPEVIIGSYLWHNTDNETTYYRSTYAGSVCNKEVSTELDEGIIRALWMSLDEIKANTDRLRSPIILESLNDYLSGVSYPLSIIKSYIK